MNKSATYDTLLSSKVTISKYHQIERDKDKTELINFVRDRFTERYITPLRSERDIKHGFCTMAVCCLMIEALESFWQGWNDTKRKSEQAFRSFFSRNRNLSVFAGYDTDFYLNVRCGILHQAETTNGWRIRRSGRIFDTKTKTINATLFHNEMENCLSDYCLALDQADWDNTVWVNFRKKMNAVIENCETN